MPTLLLFIQHEDLSVMVLKHIYSSLKGEFDEVKKRREYEDLDVSVIEEMINPKPDDIHRVSKEYTCHYSSISM